MTKANKPKKKRNILIGVVVVVAAVGALAAWASCATLPSGPAGANADAVAHKMEAFVHKDAWDQTRGLKFTFRDNHTLIWDKMLGFVDVTMGDDHVLLDLWDHGGYAQTKGVDKSGDDAKKLLDKAFAIYINDTFWLNPMTKLFDPGTTRELVTLDGKSALKVAYASGGVTPGDAYVWFVDDDGKPTSVKMWVSVIPVKGIEFKWDGWMTLKSGARIATEHGSVGMHDVADVDDAVLDTAFAKLVARRAASASAQ